MTPLPDLSAPPGLEPGLHRRVVSAMGRAVVGQSAVLDRLMVALVAGGHVLLEGVPGIGKTLMVRSLARTLEASFQRIQFTPDLLPSDILGSLVYRQETGGFEIARGPIFANLVLADEINRAPPKVQAALLEAMEETQVTLGGTTLPLDQPFMVLATQNPVEQRGTYPLAEAQLDRFMMRLLVSYPGRDDERDLLSRTGSPVPVPAVATLDEVAEARRAAAGVHVDDRIRDYVVDVVRATRDPVAAGVPNLAGVVEWGASPRAGLFLDRAARALAWLRGRSFVLPEDVKALAPDVLAHRMVLTFEAEATGTDGRAVVREVLASVPAP